MDPTSPWPVPLGLTGGLGIVTIRYNLAVYIPVEAWYNDPTVRTFLHNGEEIHMKMITKVLTHFERMGHRPEMALWTGWDARRRV